MSAAVADFTRDLAHLVRSGMPVDAALDLMAAQAPDAPLRETARDMARRVRNGESLAGAVKARGPTFGGFYGAMVGFGERSESLPEILDRLAQYLDALQRFKARAREALLYPSMVLLICLGIAMFMRKYILPTFYSLEGTSHSFDRGVHWMEIALGVAVALSGLLSTPAAAGLRWRLPHVLMENAEMHERLLECNSATLLTLVEPLALTLVGAFVAAAILSFWWPFYGWIGRMMT